jgi:hypothetical protein
LDSTSQGDPFLENDDDVRVSVKNRKQIIGIM